MSKVKCLIVDDEPIARNGIREYVEDVDFLHFSGMARSAEEAKQVLKKEIIDLIFLDIEMPGISGLSLLRSLNKPPAVIITTAYPEYAIEGFELDVVDYLIKPIIFSRFLKAVQKAADILYLNKKVAGDPAPVKNYFFLKVNSRYEKILFEDVLYIEALQNYVAVHLQSKKMLSYMPISALERQLPQDKFFRVHKSYLVALSKISSLESNQLRIEGIIIPVSRKVKDHLQRVVLASSLLRR